MYSFAKILRKIILKLPIFFVLGFGNMIGLFIGHNAKRRRISFRNVKLAFPHKSFSEVNEIIRDSCRKIGMSVISLFVISRLFKYVSARGIENIVDHEGIFVGIHEGNWELYMSYLAQQVNYTTFAKKQKIHSLDQFLNELRMEAGMKVCFTVKDFYRFLKSEGFISLAVDHGADENSAFVDFFGHLVPTPRGAAYIAKKFNKKIYPCFGYYQTTSKHVLEIGNPVDPQKYTEEEIMLYLNKFYEAYLEKYPSEYIWRYERFKYKKNINIVVLDNGVPAYQKIFEDFLNFLVCDGYHVKCEIMRLRYKNKFTQLCVNVVALIKRKNSFTSDWWLRFFLDRQSFAQLSAVCPDIMITVGDTFSSVLQLISSVLSVKSIQILPPAWKMNKTDFVVLPENTGIRYSNTIVMESVSVKAAFEDKEKASLQNAKRILFFLGKPLGNKKQFIANAKLFADKLKDFSAISGCELSVCISSYTPKDCRKYYNDALSGCSKIDLILMNRFRSEQSYLKRFIADSDCVMVSAENIALISEVIIMKRPCVGILLERYECRHDFLLQCFAKNVSLVALPYLLEDVVLI